MGQRGPIGKPAELRLLEGNTAHRAMPARTVVADAGIPERPRYLTAAARRKWDEYVERLLPLGTLKPVYGAALAELCQNAADLAELQKGLRRMASDINRQARLDGVRLKEIAEQLVDAPGDKRAVLLAERADLDARRVIGNAAVMVAKTHEGRRIMAAISSKAGLVHRQELQFGLTPASAVRLGNDGMGYVPPAMEMDPLEKALCG